jgi:uncharacterized protein YndB with AHSA1/START domain
MGKTTLTVEPGKQEMTITRTFDAPPELLFKAHIDPELLRQWLGPKRYKMTELEYDARSGGAWCFTQADAEGNTFGFHGVFHEVTPSERIVQTFEFEGWPGHVSLETATFEPQGDKTKLTIHAVYQSVADRDGMAQSGMEEGMNEGYERLDELLKEFQRGKAAVR